MEADLIASTGLLEQNQNLKARLTVSLTNEERLMKLLDEASVLLLNARLQIAEAEKRAERAEASLVQLDEFASSFPSAGLNWQARLLPETDVRWSTDLEARR
jgi:hypothetical protein